jgi:hypothetical protein
VQVVQYRQGLWSELRVGAVIGPHRQGGQRCGKVMDKMAETWGPGRLGAKVYAHGPCASCSRGTAHAAATHRPPLGARWTSQLAPMHNQGMDE